MWGRRDALPHFGPRAALRAAAKWSIPPIFRRAHATNPSTAFRFLARRIGSDLPPETGRVISVSSLTSAEATTETVLMLAWYVHEELEQDILIIDADFGEANLSAYFDASENAGFSEALASGDDFQPLVIGAREGVSILPAGRQLDRIPPKSLANLMKRARERWSYVIVQQAAIADEAQYLALAEHSDLVLLLAEEGVTRLSDINSAQSIFRQNGISDVQLLLTDSTSRRRGSGARESA